ncbi:MAG: DUF1564 family protein, partial [Leptospiraceae bacterium]|nr:DUF1564 family protein [Leptospiraceae bacterium]
FYNLGLLKISNRCKTQFQAKGQNLKRFCLKPENEDWVELSVLANGIGCTRTLLFSILLELEQRGIGCFFSYPPIFKEIYSTFSNPIYSFFKIDKDKVLRRILKFIRD